jgi:2-succinyl-5-enolpyruvyl-6-hydroxy-3-cyclohexene-1-carboxylate synthase
VNNGKGALFYHPGHALDVFGDDRNDYFAAGGHFGNMSHELVKHYAQDLGFEYLAATSKETFLDVLPRFLCRNLPKPVLLECFTAIDDEREAWTIRTGISPHVNEQMPQPLGIRKFIPQRIKNAVKALVQ